MGEHYIVTIDREHLRIFAEARNPAQFRPTLRVVASAGLGPENSSTGQEDRPLNGHFRLAVKKLPPATERRRRLAERQSATRQQVCRFISELEAFFRRRPQASWDLAASRSVFDAVVDELSPDVLRRLKRVLSEKFVHRQDGEDVSAYFALTA